MKFADVAMAFRADDQKDARGMAVVDIDNDGDLDIVINTNPGDHGVDAVAPAVLRNDIGQGRNFLMVELKGVNCNRDALGATVHIETEPGADGKPLKLMRHVHCGSGYASQNDMRLFFGLSDRREIRSLEVRWPNGKVQAFKDIQPNRLIQVIEDGQPTQLPLKPGQESVAFSASRR